MNDGLSITDNTQLSIGSSSGSNELCKAKGTYSAVCYEYSGGPVLWEDTFDNVVTYVGKGTLLLCGLSATTYFSAPYMGLISLVGWTPLSTTLSSGTYTTGTGAVTLTTGTHGLLPGDTFTITSPTGTGSFAAITGTFLATTGTTGTTLNFTIVTGLTMTITGGAVTASAPRINDTMTSHSAWTEAGSTNAPTYTLTSGGTANRSPITVSVSATGVLTLSAPASFTIGATAGTLEGAFMVFGSALSGASNTIGSTTGILLSAGAFSGGPQAVATGNIVSVSYTLSL